MSDWEILDEPMVEKPQTDVWFVEPEENPPLISTPLGPYQAKNRNIEKAAKRAVLGNVLGEQYDPENTFGSGFMDFMASADIARSNDMMAQARKFKAKYPEGDIRFIDHDGTRVTVARKSPDEKYQEFGLGPRIAEAIVNEPMALAVPLAMAGPTIPAAAGLGALGAFSGHMIKRGIEGMRGYETTPPLGELTGEAAIEGALEGGGQLVGGLIGKHLFGGRFAPGARERAMLPGIRAAEEEGFKPLVFGQVKGPVLTGMFRQVGASSPRVGETIAAQQESMLRAAQRQVDEGLALGGMSDDNLRTIVDAQTAELGQMITPGQPVRPEVGQALQKGLNTYERATSTLGSRYYDKARELSDGVSFDITAAKKGAAEAFQGVQGAGESGKAVTVSQTPRGELKRALDSITALKSPVAAYGDNESFNIIKEARTRFFDLKHSDDPFVSRTATKMWKLLSDSMDNPVGYPRFEPRLGIEAGSPTLRAAQDARNEQFRAAHNRARDFWRQREENLEKSYVAKSIASDTPEQISARYFRPGNSTALKTFEEILPRPQWEAMRQGFKLDLMNATNARSATTRLDNFKATDPQGLRTLMTPDEQIQMQKYLAHQERFQNSPLNKILSKNMTEGERALKLINDGSVKDMEDYVRLSGGQRSPQSTALKAAVYKDMLDRGTDILPSGQKVLNPQKVIETILDWEKSGKLEPLFTQADWHRIRNFQNYAAPLTESTDIGGGMMAGSLRQQLIQQPAAALWGDVKKVLKPLHTIYANDLTAWMLSRPATANIPNVALAKDIQGATAGLIQFEREMERQESLP